MPAIFSHALLILSTLLTLSTCQQTDPAFTMTQPFTSASNTFDTFGSASLHSDTIVLTPHSPSHLLGAIWSKNTNPYEFWEAEFTFRVQGAERGGNGLAFWYSGKRGLGGNVFGSVDSWDGLGLFFDPNSGGKSTVRGHLNAGDVRYETLQDPLENAFGSCPLNFRGVSEPINVKITNSRDSFKVTLNDKTCFETNQVLLPSGYYFGISASTGDSPDHHQLFSFKVTPLEPAGTGNQHVIPEAQPRARQDTTNPEVKAQLEVLAAEVKQSREETQLTLKRIESSVASIARSIGTLSTLIQQVQNEVTKSGGSSGTMQESINRLSSELNRLEGALKEHLSGHVGVLSESLVGRGGFWKGIWLVIGVQATGWVIYEYYRSKRDKPKKFL